MRYRTYLRNEVAPLLNKNPYKFFAKSFIKYQNLVDALDILDTKTLQEFQNTPAQGECSICLDYFTNRCDFIITRCNHRFHPACLIRSLESAIFANAAVCPLCRSPEKNILPDGHDGIVLYFLASWIANLNAAESCHASAIRLASHQFQSLQHRQVQNTYNCFTLEASISRE